MSMHKSGRNDNVTPGASCKVTPGFDRIPAVRMPANVPQSDITLGDYIARKTRHDAFNQVNQERKLTFDEWWKTQVFAGFKDDPIEYLRNVWNCAQENK